MLNGDRKSDPYPPTMGAMARLILESQAAGEPIILSINGKGRLPVIDHQSIQQLYELVEQLETTEKLQQSIESIAAGGPTFSLEEVIQEVKAKQGVAL